MRAWSFRLLLQGLACGALALSAASAMAEPAAAVPAADGAFVLPDRPVWAGEVFELSLQWRVDRSAFRALQGELTWSSEPLAAEAWAKPVLTDLPLRNRSVITFERAVMAPQAGRIGLEPASLGFLMQTGTVSNGDYTRAVLEPIQVRSQSATLTVRDLPAAPVGFRGAVGQFRLTSSIDRVQVKTGELVTWTLALAGRGNWPMLAALPVRALPPGLQLRDTERADERILGEFERTRRESLSFIVSEPGTYRMPAVELPIFDPNIGRYRTLVAPAVTLEATGESTTAAGIEAELLDDGIEVIKPLSGTLRAMAPLPSTRFDRWTIIGVLIVLLTWFCLACWHAWQLDPDRNVRAAHRRLARTTRRLTRIATDMPLADAVSRELRHWQQAVADRWRVSGRTPSSADFVGRDPWHSLWVECDAALYGPRGKIPADWPTSAARAVAQLAAPPPFAWRRVMQVSSWWPRSLACFLLLACGGLFCSTELPAQTAIESALEQVEREPLDVIARYNLAIALEAEGRLPEAAVHSGIVWWQEPRFDAGARLWLRLRSQAGLLSGVEGGLPEPVGAAARLKSVWPPGVWQRVHLAAGLMVIMLALLLLASAYLRHLRPALRATAVGFGVALLGFALTFAVTATSRGLLDPEAVVVHRQSILRELPVENRLDEGDWALPGAIAIVDRRFLNWVEVRLPDGRGGWVRADSVIAVWGAR
jgi:hypothetical protein